MEGRGGIMQGYEEEPEIKVLKKKSKQVGFVVEDKEAELNEQLVEKWTEREGPEKVRKDRELRMAQTL
jgi:hypothetical protein